METLKVANNTEMNVNTDANKDQYLIESTLGQYGLNWKVEKQPIQTVNGIIIPNKQAIVRSDNNAILGVHSDGYEPFQNQQMAELIYKISNASGLNVHNCGIFGNGEKVFIQLKTEDFQLPGNDEIKSYLTIVNSHDGSTQLGVGPSYLTISCKNSFYGVYRNLENKMRHTKSMGLKLENMLRRFDDVQKEQENEVKTYYQMGNVKIDEETKLLVTKLLFDLPSQEKFSFNELMENPKKRISTRKQNQIIEFNQQLLTETATKGDNLWGLFSGMTRFTTHSLNKDTTEHKMFGALGNRERKVFNELATIAS